MKRSSERMTAVYLAIGAISLFCIVIGGATLSWAIYMIKYNRDQKKPTYPIHIVDREASEPVERDSKWKAGDTLYLRQDGRMTNYKPKGEPTELGVLKSYRMNDSDFVTHTGIVRDIKTDYP